MRRRILLLVVGMTALVLLAVAIPISVLVGNEVGQDGKRKTGEQANAVAIWLSNGARTSTQIGHYVEGLSRSSGRPTQVQLPGAGTSIGTLPGGVPPLVDQQPGGMPGGQNTGPHDPGGRVQVEDVHGGALATVFVGFRGGKAGGYAVRVFSSEARLHRGQTGWLLLLAGAAVGMLALAAAAGELLTRRIVRPLTQSAQTAQRLATGDITARATTSGPPEIAEVGRALNRLADRIDELIAEERETVADLSHRLRTPLTALRLDAEALRDPAEAERVGAHVSTLERLLTAVIRAARRPQREGRLPACDARAVVGERVRFWSALTEDQGRVATVGLPDAPVPVRASAEDLGAAVDALLENVVAHTPEGTAFAVHLVPDTGAGVRLEVADAGPGLPAEQVTRGRSDRGSSGLGLSIARRTAQASGGSLRLGRSTAGGALITLVLGAP